MSFPTRILFQSICALSLSAGIFASTSYAAADDLFGTADGQSIYEKIGNLYNGGSIPTADNMSGVMIGRCFESSAPTVPAKYLTYLQGAVILAPEGPITGDIIAYGMFFSGRAAYDALDAVNSIAELESVIGERLTPNRKLAPARTADLALFAPFASDRGTVKTWARLNGSYILVKQTAPNGLDAARYCYFFKKIMNP